MKYNILLSLSIAIDREVRLEMVYKSMPNAGHSPEFLIRFEAWVKLAQQWLLCATLGIHLEPINKSGPKKRAM